MGREALTPSPDVSGDIHEAVAKWDAVHAAISPAWLRRSGSRDCDRPPIIARSFFRKR